MKWLFDNCSQVCKWNTYGYRCMKPLAEMCPIINLNVKPKPMTNADRIRAMSDEELAELLLDECRGSKCDDQPQNEWGSVNCFQCRMNWLQKTAEEDAN